MTDTPISDLSVAQWFFSPGKTLHIHEWEKLSLLAWRDCYMEYPYIARELDFMLRSRLALPDYRLLTKPLTSSQLWLCRVLPKLQKLLTALGIVMMECPDYILRRDYRQVLETVLNQAELQQLWGLWRKGIQTPSLSNQQFVESAWACGYHALDREMKEDPLWQVIRIQLPDVDYTTAIVSVSTHRILWTELQKLERFL